MIVYLYAPHCVPEIGQKLLLNFKLGLAQIRPEKAVLTYNSGFKVVFIMLRSNKANFILVS